MSLEDELKSMIVRELKIEDVDPASIADEEPLFGDGLGLDSLDAVELVVLLQKHYQVEVKDMDQGRTVLASIRALADFVRSERPGR
ncbi:MAG: acyl carrier protein [Planctomycetes bacterium]|nr:acyl carrier protein [Planctomycetota bacterium]